MSSTTNTQKTASRSYNRQLNVIDPNTLLINLGSKIAQDIEINRRARKTLSTPTVSKEKQDLLRERASLLDHVKMEGQAFTLNQLFMNIKMLGLEPTPICQAYERARVPTVSTYHDISPTIAAIQLDPSALKYIPEQILKNIGDLSNKQLELFWTAIDGRQCSKNHRAFNLTTHSWIHSYALPGDDVKCDAEMGIFPEFGLQKCANTGSIAFNQLSPMEVYSHGSPTNMLYSPDNAHFEMIPGSPFAVCWSAVQQGNRIAITRMLIVFDYGHPICEQLVNSIKNGKNLTAHLEELEKLQKPIQKTFENVIHLFEKADPSAMIEFQKLPSAFQNGIFKETWVLHKSPCNIHHNFGRASFENDPSLNAFWHCTNEQRNQAICNYVKELNQLLYVSQKELTLDSQSLIKGDNAIKLMNCAQLVQNRDEEAAMQSFAQFSNEEKEAVYLAIWELCKCPRGDMVFGANTFANPATSPLVKIKALLLAASRLQPTFQQQPEENKREEQPVKQEEQPQPIIISAPVITQTLPDLLDLTQSTIIRSSDVLGALTNLAFEETLTESARRSQIEQLIAKLDEKVKYPLYGKVYEYSTDTHKGGDNWGMHHVADDLNTLINALGDLLEEQK
jgi:hypothetical protein